jgi:hypothetical protein
MLETRGSRPYYYRNRRSGHSLQRVYVAAGDQARAAAAEDQCRRESQRAEMAEWSGLRTQFDENEALVDELHRLTSALMSYHLLSGVFHRHARSTWRRRRPG